jgi:glycosyltransferase involved in cell wall biosynthesis
MASQVHGQTLRTYKTARGVDHNVKILIVSNTSFFLHNFLLGLMSEFRREGMAVSGVAPLDDFSERLQKQGFHVIPLTQLNRKGSNPLQDLSLMLELRRIYKKERPDIVLHFTIKPNVYGSIAARLAGTKSICTVTGLGWLFTDKSLKAALGGRGYKILYRIALFSSEHVVFLNQDDRAFFLRNRLVRNGNCSVIPGTGVNTDTFHPDFCGERGSSPAGISFLLIGRMLWDKGVKEFVEAASIVKQREPAAEFLLLGPVDKENRSAVPETAIAGWESKGIVQYLGRTDDVRPFICGTDAVVLPSYREGAPSSLLEAMAMGKPVITTDAPGCKEVVEDGKTGFIAPMKDAQALAECMLHFIGLSPAERENMGKQAREKTLREFDEKILVSAYLQLVRNALRPPKTVSDVG